MPSRTDAWGCLVLMLVAFGTACSTTTTITSSPSGAKVYIDGVVRGATPLTLTLPDGSDHGYKSIRVEKEGYLPTETAIGRKQDPVRLVCGRFCLVPMLWVYKYEPRYSVVLKEVGSEGPAPVSPPNPSQPGPANQL